MYQNKNLIIIILSILLVILSIAYIALYNKEIVLPEPVVETIVQEKIVYVTKAQKTIKPIQKKEIKKEKVEVVKEEITYDLPEVEVPLTKDNEFIITSTRDNKGRFTISLISSKKPPKKAFYDRKIILESEIESDAYIGKFLFLVPPVLVDNISELSIKITDAVSGNSYIETAYCLDGIESAYKYSMNVSFTDGFSCYIQETGKAFKIPKPSEASKKRMLDIFTKLQKENKSKE